MIAIRRISRPRELAEVDALYRGVFGIAAEDNGLNVRLLVALSSNSGHVIGAYDGARLVGFGLSFLAHDRGAGRLYQYSQTVAVAPDAQGRQVGRAVKYGQRDAALADGVDLMRWAFDPMHARNAHFNLDVLGGRILSTRPDFYGSAAAPPDRGERTDRCLIDWELSAPARLTCPHVDAAGLAPGQTVETGGAVLVGVPLHWREFRREVGAAAGADVRAATVEAIGKALAQGLVGVSCRRVDATTAAYVLVPGRAA